MKEKKEKKTNFYCLKTFFTCNFLGGGGRCFSGADLSGLVMTGWVALALMLLGPLSLQVRPNDGFKRHCPPHARTQLVQPGLSCCKMQTLFIYLFIFFNQGKTCKDLVTVVCGQISKSWKCRKLWLIVRWKIALRQYFWLFQNSKVRVRVSNFIYHKHY